MSQMSRLTASPTSHRLLVSVLCMSVVVIVGGVKPSHDSQRTGGVDALRASLQQHPVSSLSPHILRPGPGPSNSTSRCTITQRTDYDEADCRPYDTIVFDERQVLYQLPLGTPPPAGWPVVIMFQGVCSFPALPLPCARRAGRPAPAVPAVPPTQLPRPSTAPDEI
eukprot:TRINITY_DN760_c0_g1_i6.p1 TRINITY_DN760_c0_g1~~TRINITY_DN760_c0_g1_i6.p1  ORF type:complete len:166 (-),score=16.23 TRINITY_DN760_c0_g1_i6:1176-1673(-)